MMTADELSQIQEQNPHGISYGGMHILFLMGDDEPMCFDCVKENPEEINSEMNEPCDRRWQIKTDFAHWEGQPLECSHCYKELPSHYGDPEEEN